MSLRVFRTCFGMYREAPPPTAPKVLELPAGRQVRFYFVKSLELTMRTTTKHLTKITKRHFEPHAVNVRNLIANTDWPTLTKTKISFVLFVL